MLTSSNNPTTLSSSSSSSSSSPILTNEKFSEELKLGLLHGDINLRNFIVECEEVQSNDEQEKEIKNHELFCEQPNLLYNDKKYYESQYTIEITNIKMIDFSHCKKTSSTWIREKEKKQLMKNFDEFWD